MPFWLAKALALLWVDRGYAAALHFMLDWAFDLPKFLVKDYLVWGSFHEVGLVSVIRRHQKHFANLVLISDVVRGVGSDCVRSTCAVILVQGSACRQRLLLSQRFWWGSTLFARTSPKLVEGRSNIFILRFLLKRSYVNHECISEILDVHLLP